MANLEDLKDNWQTQSGISQERFDQIGSKVRDTSTLLRSTIFRRDVVETIASALVCVIFAPGLFTAKNWVAWSGFAIVVIVGITIPFVLRWARRSQPAEFSAASFRDFVDVEIDYLSRQVQLLRRLAWWYLLPIYVGIVLIVVGLTGPRYTTFDVVFLATYLVFCAGLFVFIWRLNQAAHKRRLEPLLDHFIEMRTSLDRDDESALRHSDPPSAFLQPMSRKPMTRRRRWTWIASTVAVTTLVAAAGYVTMQSFDARSGKFVLSSAAVIALLMVFASGIWRRNSD